MIERALSSDTDRVADGDELVFDDGGAPGAQMSAPAKRLKTGRKAATPAAPEPEIFPAPPEEATAPEAPAPEAPAAVIVAEPRLPIPAWLLIAALCLSLFTSTMACIGLLVASRTIAHAGQAREAAEAQTAQLAHLPATLEALDRLVAQEQVALANLQQGRASQPATVGDLQRGLDGLRAAIAQIQPQRDQELAGLTKAGQAEIAERLGDIADTLDHMNTGAKRDH